MSIAEPPWVRSRAGKLSEAYTHTREPYPKLKPTVKSRMPIRVKAADRPKP